MGSSQNPKNYSNFISLILWLLCHATAVSSQISHCGSLITYRQFSTLLAEDQPQCLRDGCGNASSMSSDCEGSPCSPIWNILRGQYQQDWCSSCPDDVACRIRGWPVLNVTAACAIDPHEWLFANSSQCCTSTDEPFQIAKWVNSLCNGAGWRAPFEHYGGMARDDWHEWIEPWNWTVTTIPYQSCASRFDFLSGFMIDNIVEAASFLFFTGFSILILHYNGPNDDNVKLWEAVSAGMSSLLMILIGNILSAKAIAKRLQTPSFPQGELFLLFCTSPSLLMILCTVQFLISRSEKKYLSRYLSAAPKEIRQDLAKAVISLATTAIFLQIFAAIFMFRTAIIGTRKNFYHANNLTPFWLGKSTQTMYAGALLWIVLFFFTIMFLCLLWWYMVNKLKHEVSEKKRKRRKRVFKTDEESLKEKYRDIDARNEELMEEIRKRQNSADKFRDVVRSTLRAGIIPGYAIFYENEPEPNLPHGATEEERSLANRYEQEATEIERELYNVIQDRELANQLEPKRYDYTEVERNTLTSFVLGLGILSFITQWLFWVGYVDSMGDR